MLNLPTMHGCWGPQRLQQRPCTARPLPGTATQLQGTCQRPMQHPHHSQVCASAPQRASASTSPRSAPADHQQFVHVQPLRSRHPHQTPQVMPEPLQQQGAQQRLPHRLNSPQQQQQHKQLQLLSQDSGKGTARQQPEPPTTSGGPPPDVASTSGAKTDNNNNNNNTSSSGSLQGTSADASSSNSSNAKPAPVSSVEDEVDQVLDKLWANFKQDLKKELPPDQASMLDKWSPSDIQTDKVFREMANHQLGPFLQSMGIQEDPYDFFLDLFRLALVFQLAAAGLVFYTMELGLGGNVGDAFRAVAGLLLGYTLRLGIKVEQLAWPVYNGLVQLLISEGATYEIAPASAEEQRDTLNRLGVALAVAFLVPKFAFGWQNEECWQIVVPMLGGLFFFDVAYMFALLIKLNMGDDDKK